MKQTYIDLLVMALVTELELDIDNDDLEALDDLLTKLSNIPDALVLLEEYLPEEKLSNIKANL